MEQFEDRFPPDYFWRDGGGEFQDYYDGRYVIAGFYAPLTYTLTLTNGTGSPALTRATEMWVFDDEDKLVNVPASAAAFSGARRVRNMLSSPDVLANQGVTTEAKTYTISFYGTGSVAFSGTYAGASLAGTGASDRVQRTFTATAGTLTLTVTGSVTTAQFENVTGQADQTASEYVSGDQGAGVNNLKWFGTNKDGTPIPPTSLLGLASNKAAVTNTILSCRRFAASTIASTCPWRSSVTGGVEKVTNGTFDTDVSGWTIGIGTGATLTWNALGYMDCYCGTTSNEFATQTLTGLTIGETYTVSYDRISSSATVGIYVTTSGIIMQSGFSSTASTRELTFIATGTSHTLSLVAANAGTSATFDNVTCKKADVQIQNNQTGLDNASNSCSLLTATAANATILQTITAAAAAGCTGFYVKRSVGTGTISITRDGGSTWTDITSLINSTTFTKVKIENTSVTNPSVGFKISTSGDAIIVDGGINHLGTNLHYLPILTTSAAVTVNAQTLTYPDTGNIIDADGTVMATVTMDDWTGVDGGVVGSTTHGLFATATGASAKDGTNTPTGASDTPSGTVKIGMKYTTDFMRTMSDAGFGTATDYTGSLATDLTNISINSGVTGYVKDVAIWQEVISDYKMRNMP